MNRDELIVNLKKGACKVKFTKVNGEQRVMNCTLSEALVPPTESQSDSTSTRKKSDQVVAVWDLDKTAWRSFRVDSVNDFCLT